MQKSSPHEVEGQMCVRVHSKTPNYILKSRVWHAQVVGERGTPYRAKYLLNKYQKKEGFDMFFLYTLM